MALMIVYVQYIYIPSYDYFHMTIWYYRYETDLYGLYGLSVLSTHWSLVCSQGFAPWTSDDVQCGRLCGFSALDCNTWRHPWVKGPEQGDFTTFQSFPGWWHYSVWADLWNDYAPTIDVTRICIIRSWVASIWSAFKALSVSHVASFDAAFQLKTFWNRSPKLLCEKWYVFGATCHKRPCAYVNFWVVVGGMLTFLALAHMLDATQDAGLGWGGC